MKIIVGCSFLAKENIAAVRFCDSPYHLSNREVTFKEKYKIINSISSQDQYSRNFESMLR